MIRLSVVMVFALGCAPNVSDKTRDKARSMAAEVDANRLFADVETLARGHGGDSKVSCAALNASSETWCNLSNAEARRFVENRLRSLGLEPRIDRHDTHPVTETVFAELRGTSKPGEVVLLGAHVDAFFQGADDNSSSVAVMLEVARLLATRPLARTVRFVGFDLEEIGLVGSTRHVDSMTRPRVALVLDCVGYSDGTPGSQGSLPGFPVPPAGDFIAAIANDVSRPRLEEVVEVAREQQTPPIQSIVAPLIGAGPLSGNLMRSDHAPFWLAGESALFFTDTANFRNPYYHTAQDTPETLDRNFLAGVARLTAMSIVTWADAP